MRKVIVFGIGIMLLWSCNNSTEKSTKHQGTESQTEHHHDESSEAIELNNGEKWLVNEEMNPIVLKGEELVNTYIKAGKTDYKTLSEQIKDQNSKLIKSCTMDGISHDELHKWLHTHLEIVKALGNETDATKANEIVLQLQHSYQNYHKYFN
ncbi:hypothetical protein KB553_09380 [Chryseobacterium rhizoplanae]|uniref:hypothetical protein n=1 Tax=Chryseobacterium rhizoplanae TaxID=1609531 RepID=UPI001CE31CAB|nr:hypothetical protein [Chryseobacterium rhizoplanae]UCA61727.1 hypothetical protein KB553_09380 [Chryseobacterium rhizoplanae]